MSWRRMPLTCSSIHGKMRDTRNYLIVILICGIMAKTAVWTPKHSEYQEPSHVFHEPVSILDHIWNMDSTWNHSHTGTKKDDDQAKSLSHLLETLTQPTRQCRKLVQLGGIHCYGRPDGAKKICLDDSVYPGLDLCLAYSFGVGNDFTFDFDMIDFGCQVYAFDQDKVHANYPREIYGVRLVNVRLGKSNLISHDTQLDGSLYIYTYLAMDNIMWKLRHHNVTLDYLKMDIEGAEWEVFTESVFKTDILQRTKQLALEFHLEEFNTAKNKTEEQRQEGLKLYQRVIDGLHEIGFELVWFEPNFKMPVTSTVGEKTFHIYGETLWVNTKWKKPQVLPASFQKQISLGNTRRKVESKGWSWDDLSVITPEKS